MVQLGSGHAQADIQRAFVQIVDNLDDARRRLDAVAQWGQLHSAADLAAEWDIPVADAQQYLDVCASFGGLITSALTADPRLGEYLARIRNVGR